MSALSINSLTALAWTFTGVGVALTAGRYAIRMKTVGHLHWADAVHGFGVAVLIAYIATYTVFFPRAYAIEFWVAGMRGAPSDDDLNSYFRIEMAVSMMFWVIIYAVKFSFLLFYRELFGVSRRFMNAWWVVLAFTLLTFLACFLSVIWECGRPQDLFMVEACLSDSTLSVTAKVVTFWCPLNVISDLLIMGLPLFMIKDLQMPTSRKLGLAAVFIIATVDVVFDILRTIYTVHGGAVALDTIWDILEPTIAVIVSCLPTYRALSKTGRKRSRSYKNLVPIQDASIPACSRQEYEMSTSLRSKAGADESYSATASCPNVWFQAAKAAGAGPAAATDIV